MEQQILVVAEAAAEIAEVEATVDRV